MHKALSLLSSISASVIATSILICPPAFATEADGEVAYWGFIDVSGKLAIKPQFLSVGGFHEGLAAVQISVKGKDDSTNEKWGFIDKSGKMVIEAQFEDVQEFSDGLAAARQDKWGFIDKSGKFVIEPQFENVGTFNEGLAQAATGHLKWGFIDRTGAFKIEPNFASTGDFANNRAAVLISDGFGSYTFKNGIDTYEVRGGQWSYIDKSGQIVIDSLFDGAGLFCQELAPAAVGIKQGMNKPDKWGFINTDGKLAITPQFNAVHAASENCAAVQYGTWKNIGRAQRSWIAGKWGYITLRGKRLIAPQFDGADRFSEGLASVLIKDKWGYINKDGKMVISPNYCSTGEFHEQLAPVILASPAL